MAEFTDEHARLIGQAADALVAGDARLVGRISDELLVQLNRAQLEDPYNAALHEDLGAVVDLLRTYCLRCARTAVSPEKAVQEYAQTVKRLREWARLFELRRETRGGPARDSEGSRSARRTQGQAVDDSTGPAANGQAVGSPESQGERSGPPECDASDGDTADGEQPGGCGEGVREPRPAEMQAWHQFTTGCEALGLDADTANQREVHAKLSEIAEERGGLGQLGKLPKLDTWERNLRRYRNAMNLPRRKQPRAGRAENARSVIRLSER